VCDRVLYAELTTGQWPAWIGPGPRLRDDRLVGRVTVVSDEGVAEKPADRIAGRNPPSTPA